MHVSLHAWRIRFNAQVEHEERRAFRVLRRGRKRKQAVRGADAGNGAQGYEMIQGALVRWSEMSPAVRPPPTAVLVHGILGSRKNMQSFARRLVQVPHQCFAK